MIVKIKLKLEDSESSDCESLSFKGKVTQYETETMAVGMAIYNAVKGVAVCRAIAALATAVDMLRHELGTMGADEEAFCREAENVIEYWDKHDTEIHDKAAGKASAVQAETERSEK